MLKRDHQLFQNTSKNCYCYCHTSYLSPRSPIYRWRKISHVEKISDFNTWQMWRNFKFLHMQRNFSFFHTIDAEKCEFLPNLEEFHISPHDRCEEIKNLPCFVVVKSVLWRITLFFKIRFGAIYALLRGEKLSKKLDRWRKSDKYEVCSKAGWLSPKVPCT